MSCQPIAGYEREMFSAGCTMNIGSKKLLREVESTFCGAHGSGPLQEPWPIAVAPHNFGQFSGALLIGNFEDGRINAYDRKTREFLGQLTDKNGNPISNGFGLWALVFRPDQDQDHPARLFFTTGTNGESDGLFGAILPVSH